MQTTNDQRGTLQFSLLVIALAVGALLSLLVAFTAGLPSVDAARPVMAAPVMLHTLTVLAIPTDTALLLMKTVTPAEARPNQRITYQLVVSNPNSVTFTIALTDRIPISVAIVGFPAASQGTTTLRAGALLWSAPLSPTQSATLTYQAEIGSTVTDGDLIVNRAIIEAVGTGITGTASATVTVYTERSAFLPVIHRVIPTTAPTPTPTATPPFPVIRNGNFEDDPDTSWEELARPFNNILIVTRTVLPSRITPHSGERVVWLGGAPSETYLISQSLFLPRGYPSIELRYHYWINSDERDTGDNGYASINGSRLITYSLSRTTNMDNWQQQRGIELNQYAGMTVTLSFGAQLDADENSNFFIDDVVLCPCNE
jgi:hypothetical protein